MDEVWHEAGFYIAIRLHEDKGAKFYSAWANEPDRDLPANVKLLRMKLKLPESMWKLPVLRGTVKSDLKQEYELFMEEITEGTNAKTR